MQITPAVCFVSLCFSLLNLSLAAQNEAVLEVPSEGSLHLHRDDGEGIEWSWSGVTTERFHGLESHFDLSAGVIAATFGDMEGMWSLAVATTEKEAVVSLEIRGHEVIHHVAALPSEQTELILSLDFSSGKLDLGLTTFQWEVVEDHPSVFDTLAIRNWGPHELGVFYRLHLSTVSIDPAISESIQSSRAKSERAVDAEVVRIVPPPTGLPPPHPWIAMDAQRRVLGLVTDPDNPTGGELHQSRIDRSAVAVARRAQLMRVRLGADLSPDTVDPLDAKRTFEEMPSSEITDE